MGFKFEKDFVPNRIPDKDYSITVNNIYVQYIIIYFNYFVHYYILVSVIFLNYYYY